MLPQHPQPSLLYLCSSTYVWVDLLSTNLSLFWTWWYCLPQQPSLASDSRSSSMLFSHLWIKIQESSPDSDTHVQASSMGAECQGSSCIPQYGASCQVGCYGSKGHWTPPSSCAMPVSPAQRSAIPCGPVHPPQEQLRWASQQQISVSSPMSFCGWIALLAPVMESLSVIGKSQAPAYMM